MPLVKLNLSPRTAHAGNDQSWIRESLSVSSDRDCNRVVVKKRADDIGREVADICSELNMEGRLV